MITNSKVYTWDQLGIKLDKHYKKVKYLCYKSYYDILWIFKDHEQVN